jgi:hypothetical protein
MIPKSLFLNQTIVFLCYLFFLTNQSWKNEKKKGMKNVVKIYSNKNGIKLQSKEIKIG